MNCNPAGPNEQDRISMARTSISWEERGRDEDNFHKRCTERAVCLFRGANAVLPVRPNKPDEPDAQCGNYEDIELMKIFAQVTPVFTHFHADICEGQTPGPGSQKRINMEARAWHAGDSRRQGNECPHDRQHAGNEDGQIAPAEKETIRPIQFSTR